MYQDVPDTVAELGAQHPCWHRKEMAIERRRYSRWRHWRFPAKRLEQPDVEHIMEANARRKLKTVGHLPNARQHLEWPGIVRTQLPLGPGHQRVCRTVKDTEPHPIAHHELQVPMGVIVVALGELLGLKKTLANLH